MEDALEERAVALARLRLFDLVDAQRRPGVHGRVHVGEVPLVRRDLAVRMHVPLAQHEHELVLGELRVHERQDDAVEREIPGRVPRELPRVGHRQDVGVEDVAPVAVAAGLSGGGRGRLERIAVEPAPDVVLVELLGPEHSRERLPHHVLLVGRQPPRNDRGVELVGLGAAQRQRAVELRAQRIAAGRLDVGQPQAHARVSAGGYLEALTRRGLGALSVRVDGGRVSADDVLMEGVLDVRRGAGRAEDALGVGLVLGEEQLGVGSDVEVAAPEVVFLERHELPPVLAGPGGREGALAVRPPRPCVAEPHGGQQVDGRRLRAAVLDRDLDEDVLRAGLRILDEDVEVAALGKDARVEQLVLGLLDRAPAVLLDQLPVRVFRVRVLVQVLHVRVRRRRVEVEPVLLDVLAVVALGVRQAEGPLLEDRVLPVPEREREADELVAVGDPAEAVFVPAIGA